MTLKQFAAYYFFVEQLTTKHVKREQAKIFLSAIRISLQYQLVLKFVFHRLRYFANNVLM